MKEIDQSTTQKRPYQTPGLLTVRLMPSTMISASTPEVHTTTESAEVEYEILTKDRHIWDDEW